MLSCIYSGAGTVVCIQRAQEEICAFFRGEMRPPIVRHSDARQHGYTIVTVLASHLNNMSASVYHFRTGCRAASGWTVIFG